MLELLGRSAGSGCRTPLQKKETKRIDGGSPVVSPMPRLMMPFSTGTGLERAGIAGSVCWL